jgi:hypothetical protein
MGGLFNIGHTFVAIIIILGHLCVFFNTFSTRSDMFFLTLKVTKYNDQRVATCFDCMCYSKNNIGQKKHLKWKQYLYMNIIRVYMYMYWEIGQLIYIINALGFKQLHGNWYNLYDKNGTSNVPKAEIYFSRICGIKCRILISSYQ